MEICGIANRTNIPPEIWDHYSQKANEVNREFLSNARRKENTKIKKSRLGVMLNQHDKDPESPCRRQDRQHDIGKISRRGSTITDKITKARNCPKNWTLSQ